MTRFDTDRGSRPQLTIIGASMPDGALAYLATPYSKYEGGIEMAFREAAELTGRLLTAGVPCYSPIAHCHPMSRYADIDAYDHSIWLPYQEMMMQRCEVLIVAQLRGWKESKGINHEIAFFTKRKRLVFLLDPVSMQMRRMIGTAASLPSERESQSS